jgi:hypothetical protein
MKSETHAPKFKTQVVLELLREGCSPQSLIQKYNLEERELIKWKKEFLDLAENMIVQQQKEEIFFRVKKQKKHH